VKVVEDLAQIESVRVALGIWIEERLRHNLGTKLIPEERDHRARIEIKNHRLDSKAVSSALRRNNASLEVGI